MLDRSRAMDATVAWSRAAQLALLAAVIDFLGLHLAPRRMLHATTGAVLAYDARLNFLSEFVRTQYGPAMTANFVLLGTAGFAAALAMRSAAHEREAWMLAGLGVLLVLLALLP